MTGVANTAPSSHVNDRDLILTLINTEPSFVHFVSGAGSGWLVVSSMWLGMNTT